MPNREKVIHALEVCSTVQDLAPCPNECPYHKPDAVCYGTARLMQDALALLREQERPGWVSVQDRLPEKYGSYLTLREGQLMPPQMRMAVRFWTGNKDGEYWRGAEAGSRIVGITHWMALPEPPEEVSGDAD